MAAKVGLLLLTLALAACATRLWRATLVDDYPNVRVRIYRMGSQCRIEVEATNEMIHTAITRCVAVPQRPRTN